MLAGQIFSFYFGQKLTRHILQVIMELFGLFIREHRQRAGLTLTQLASEVGMDSANLSKVETGKRRFDERKLYRLANALGLDPDRVMLEYYSDRIAALIAHKPNPQTILQAAAEKIRYYRQRTSTQIEFEF